jgi:hypothetical protein
VQFDDDRRNSKHSSSLRLNRLAELGSAEGLLVHTAAVAAWRITSCCYCPTGRMHRLTTVLSCSTFAVCRTAVHTARCCLRHQAPTRWEQHCAMPAYIWQRSVKCSACSLAKLHPHEATLRRQQRHIAFVTSMHLIAIMLQLSSTTASTEAANTMPWTRCHRYYI